VTPDRLAKARVSRSGRWLMNWSPSYPTDIGLSGARRAWTKTLNRAKIEMGIVSEKEKRSGGKWIWRLGCARRRAASTTAVANRLSTSKYNRPLRSPKNRSGPYLRTNPSFSLFGVEPNSRERCASMTENSAIFNARDGPGSFHPHRQPAPTAQDCLKTRERGKLASNPEAALVQTTGAWQFPVAPSRPGHPDAEHD
jgi:hypothetical protein